MGLAALERQKSLHILLMGKTMSLMAVFDRILFILAGIEDMYKSLNEIEFWPDPTTDYVVICS